MGCDYYVLDELVIQYQDKNGRLSSIHTNRQIYRGYIFEPPDHDSDDDSDTISQKYQDELERKIEENTRIKILFQNQQWTKESYKKKYEGYLMKTYKEIVKIIKVYKDTRAWKRT